MLRNIMVTSTCVKAFVMICSCGTLDSFHGPFFLVVICRCDRVVCYAKHDMNNTVQVEEIEFSVKLLQVLCNKQ